MALKDLNNPLSNVIKTMITYKDGSCYNGYFYAFDDHEALKNEGKFRFIPESNVNGIQTQFAKTKKLDVSYSMVIHLQQVDDIELLKS